MIVHNNCPLCGSNKIHPFLSTSDHLVSREHFSIYACDSCTFLFTQGYPEEDAIGKYYESEDYISHTSASRNIIEWLYGYSRQIMLRRKRRFISGLFNKGKKSLLDIGSGTGHFLNVMKNIGWDVSGIEINPGARQYSKDVFNLNVYDSSFLKTSPASSFDCITLWHVLEHFHSPGEYLMEIKKMLKPCGKVIIALPNAASADAIFYKNKWAAWDVPRHLWHFTPDTFRKFASKHGFRIKQVKGLPLDVFYISVLSEKHKGSSGAIFKGMTKGLIFTISSLFDSARKSSLIYVLEADESISVEPAIPS